MNRLLRKDPVIRKAYNEVLEILAGQKAEFILYGSRARGDALPDADYDALLVVEEVTSELKKSIDRLVGKLLYEDGVLWSIIPVSRARYDAERYNPLFVNIRHEGVCL